MQTYDNSARVLAALALAVGIAAIVSLVVLDRQQGDITAEIVKTLEASTANQEVILNSTTNALNMAASAKAEVAAIGKSYMQDKYIAALADKEVDEMRQEELVLLLRTTRYKEARKELERRQEDLKRLNNEGSK
jgi:hypothetical protein